MCLGRRDFLKLMGISYFRDISSSARVRGERPLRAEAVSGAEQTHRQTAGCIHLASLGVRLNFLKRSNQHTIFSPASSIFIFRAIIRTFCLSVGSESLEMYRGQLCSSFLFFFYKWKSGSSEESGRKEANVHLGAETSQ